MISLPFQNKTFFGALLSITKTALVYAPNVRRSQPPTQSSERPRDAGAHHWRARYSLIFAALSSTESYMKNGLLGATCLELAIIAFALLTRFRA